MTQFYKFGNPRSKRYASDGSLIPITITDVGGETGVFGTNDANLQRELNLMAQRQEQGVWIITSEEYHSLKKNQVSSPIWREEISRAGLERNKVPVYQAQPVPVPPPASPVAAAAAKSAIPSADVRPTATKRKAA